MLDLVKIISSVSENKIIQTLDDQSILIEDDKSQLILNPISDGLEFAFSYLGDISCSVTMEDVPCIKGVIKSKNTDVCIEYLKLLN